MVLWIKKEIICGYKYKQLDKNVQLGYSIERVKRKRARKWRRKDGRKKHKERGGQVDKFLRMQCNNNAAWQAALILVDPFTLRFRLCSLLNLFCYFLCLHLFSLFIDSLLLKPSTYTVQPNDDMQLMLENLQCLLMDASMISILIATVVAISSFLLVLRMSHYYPEYSSYREFLQSLLSGIIIMCGTIAHYTGLRYLAALPRIYVQSGMICYGIISLLHPILPRLSTLRLSFATVRWALRSRSTILDDDVSCDDCQRFDGLSYSRCNVATRSTAVHNLSNPLQFTRYDPDSICIRPGAPLPLVSGLVNTGNSCYLNSVLQVTKTK